MDILSFKKIQARSIVISPNIDDVTDAYCGLLSSPAENTHQSANPSAHPIAINHGIAEASGQNVRPVR